jgi:hypothetical protein
MNIPLFGITGVTAWYTILCCGSCKRERDKMLDDDSRPLLAVGASPSKMLDYV